MKKKNIIIFGLQPWDINIGSNCKNIAQEWAKTHRVLYVNRPLSRIDWLKRPDNTIVNNRIAVLQGKQEPLTQVAENLWVLTPPIVLESIQWLPTYSIFKWFNKWNSKRLANCIQTYAAKLGFSDFVLFNDSAMFQGQYLKELLQPEQMIYYIRDYLIAQPYFKKHGPQAEETLIKKADVVVSNSTYLAEYAKGYNSNSHFVGQGCDLTIFDANAVGSAKHPLLQDEKRPIVGYVGLLTEKRLDISLLENIAKARPDFCLVLVGPEDDAFEQSALHALDNVRFLGFQPYESLPLFIHSFDVCINPQLVNPLSMGNYPRKIDEYLAMGKAVVATRTKAMEYFEDYVYLAEDLSDYLRYISLASRKSDNREKKLKRIRFAQSHTWANSVKAIEQAATDNHNAYSSAY